MKDILHIHDLDKSYGGNQLLQGVNLQLVNNSINLLTGDNGTGKTTLFNIIAGLEQLDAGTIEFANRNMKKINTLGRAKLGMTRLFQNPRVFKNLTVEENIKVSTKDKLLLSKSLGLLDDFGLSDVLDYRTGSLSYGQQKIVAFCMIIVNKPKLILLDEPLAGIAKDIIPVLKRELVTLRQMGTCLFIIEHKRKEIIDICDSEYLLKNRKINQV